MNRLLRDALTSVSAVNVFLIPVWSSLFQKEVHDSAGAWAALILFAVLAAAVFLLTVVIRRWTGKSGTAVARLLMLAGVCLTVAITGKGYLASFASMVELRFGTLVFRSVEAALIVGVLVFLAVAGRQLFSVVRMALLLLLPFCLLTVGRTAALAFSSPGPEASAVPALPPVPVFSGTAPHRVLFLLFDELDYGVAVERRPAGLDMPEFDRLRQESFFATQAWPPGSETHISMPAMMSGKLPVAGSPAAGSPAAGSKDVAGEGQLVTPQPGASLFQDLHTRGLRTLRLGGIFPDGYLDPAGNDRSLSLPPPPLPTIRQALAGHLRLIAFLLPMSGSMNGELTTNLDAAARELNDQIMAGIQLARAGDADFIYLHFMLPHLPVLYSPSTREFTGNSGGDYVDNVAGVDDLLGRIRRAMEETGSWDRTTVIVAADHWWRRGVASGRIPRDHRVPFMVKFAGRSDHLEYNRPFNTVLFRRMVDEVLMSSGADSGELARWLDANATFGESPLTLPLK